MLSPVHRLSSMPRTAARSHTSGASEPCDGMAAMTQVGRQDGPLHPATAREVRTLAAQAREADGVEALGEQTLLNLTDPAASVVHVLAGTPGGALEGYGQVESGQTLTGELVVAPRARGRGVGRALLDEILALAAENDADPALWAHGDLPAARALATAGGLEVRRELWQMSLEFADAQPPSTQTPDGVVVRPFVTGQDEDAWLRVNARAFVHHPEQGRMTRHDLEMREAEPWFCADDLLLAEQDGRLLASVWMKVEPGSDTGELYVLGVDPGAQGRGLGRLLTALTIEHLLTKGLERVLLYASPTDAAAVRTYRSAGFVTSRSDVQYGPASASDGWSAEG